MAKEIEIPKAHLIDRVKKWMESFEEQNGCRLICMVAYKDEPKVIGVEETAKIQLRLLSNNMPDEFLPLFLQLFLGMVEDAKNRAKESEQKTESNDK